MESPHLLGQKRRKKRDLLPQDEDSAKGMGSAQETQRGSVDKEQSVMRSSTEA